MLPVNPRRHGGAQYPNYLYTSHTSQIGECGLDRFVQANGIPVEVHILNAIDLPRSCIVASSDEQRICTCIALKVNAVDNDRELVGGHVQVSVSFLRYASRADTAPPTDADG